MAHNILTHEYGTCTSCFDKDALIARLTAERDAAEYDPIWDMHKREGIERRLPHLSTERVALVIDMDYMHDSNREHGHDGVDWRMTKLANLLRKADADLLIGRWLRGDEVVLFPLRDDAVRMAERLRGCLWGLGLSATAAIGADCSHASIAACIALIEQAKEAGQRGRVFVVEGVLA